MKKIYLNPEIEVVKIDAPKIMAGSPDLSNSDAVLDGNDYKEPLSRDIDLFLLGE